MLWQAGKRCRLLIAGPEMPNFTRFWRTLPDSRHITKLGVLNDEEKRDFYAAIDLFTLPSRSDSFGIVFLEAWTNGMPCIAYRAGGVVDVIHHEQDGLLVNCGDILGLASAIDQLSRESGRRRQMGEAGRIRVQNDCAWQPRLERVHEAYRGAIEQNRFGAERGRAAPALAVP
jgi:glycosyltransferase involved in cell wall biosynthesis